MRRCETFESIRNGFLYPRRFKATTSRSRADCIGWDGEHWQLLVVVEHVESKNNQVEILQVIWSGTHLFWWKFPGSLQWIHVESAVSAVSWLEDIGFFPLPWPCARRLCRRQSSLDCFGTARAGEGQVEMIPKWSKMDKNGNKDCRSSKRMKLVVRFLRINFILESDRMFQDAHCGNEQIVLLQPACRFAMLYTLFVQGPD